MFGLMSVFTNTNNTNINSNILENMKGTVSLVSRNRKLCTAHYGNKLHIINLHFSFCNQRAKRKFLVMKFPENSIL